MMSSLPAATWERLIVWMIIGLAIYFFYSRSHSKLAAPKAVLDLLSVPQQRRESIERLARELRAGRSVAISTHHQRRRRRVRIRDRAIAAAWPAGDPLEDRQPDAVAGDVPSSSSAMMCATPSDAGAKALKEADVLVVLDISDVKRLGVLAEGSAQADDPQARDRPPPAE